MHFENVQALFFSRVKTGEIVQACFHNQFFGRNCVGVVFRFTGAFLGFVHWLVVKVSREKKKNWRYLPFQRKTISFSSLDRKEIN